MEIKNIDNHSFLRKYWYGVVGIFVFIILFISYLLQTLTPKRIATEKNSWNGIAPQISSIKDIEKTGAQLVGTEDSTLGIVYSYKSQFPTIPNRVIADKNGNVLFIEEQVVFDKEKTIEEYNQQFGEANIVLDDPTRDGATKAYVYLKQGVAVFGHIDGDAIEKKWYFTPTTLDGFKMLWENINGKHEETGGEFIVPDESL